jgi:hypothetical protein
MRGMKRQRLTQRKLEHEVIHGLMNKKGGQESPDGVERLFIRKPDLFLTTSEDLGIDCTHTHRHTVHHPLGEDDIS